MKGALIILAVTVAFGLLLFFNEQRRRRGTTCHHDAAEETSAGGTEPAQTENGDEAAAGKRPSGCCGRHIVCEKLDSPYVERPQYYDDEELDAYTGIPEEGYTPSQVEEFREVLITLRPGEIRGWLDSLSQRNISLPLPLRDEAIILLEEG